MTIDHYNNVLCILAQCEGFTSLHCAYYFSMELFSWGSAIEKNPDPQVASSRIKISCYCCPQLPFDNLIIIRYLFNVRKKTGIKREALSGEKRLALGIIQNSILQGDRLDDRHNRLVVIKFCGKRIPLIASVILLQTSWLEVFFIFAQLPCRFLASTGLSFCV